MKLTLLRHGATTAVAGTLLGHTDAPLSAEGYAAMMRAWSQINRTPVDTLASSDLARCAQFAQERGIPVTLDAGWREVALGGLDGRHALSEAERLAWGAWYADPAAGNDFGAESWHDFAERVFATTERWLATQSAQHALIVTHGGVMRALLTRWLDLPARSHSQFHVPYAGWVSVEWDAAWPPILTEISHVA
ncbi:histidine phosphatase family protein [Chitinibacteraceae bacterium HSL-7]